MASSGAVEKERETSSSGMNNIEHTISAIKNLSLDDDESSSSGITTTSKGKRKMPDEFNDDDDEDDEDDFFKDYYSEEYLLRQAESEKEKEKRLSQEIEESLITKLSRMAIVSTPQMKKKTRKVAESDDCGKVLAKIEEAIKRRECVRVLIRVVLVVMKTLVQECTLPHLWNVINILLCSYVGYMRPDRLL
ncbi:hypothetical protein ACP275_14G241900 [Erythranthe tilingii]